MSTEKSTTSVTEVTLIPDIFFALKKWCIPSDYWHNSELEPVFFGGKLQQSFEVILPGKATAFLIIQKHSKGNDNKIEKTKGRLKLPHTLISIFLRS